MNKIMMPKVTPHICRHTYCTIQVLRQLKYLAGHSDISVTLNYYTHINKYNAKDELDRLAEEEQGKRRHNKLTV